MSIPTNPAEPDPEPWQTIAELIFAASKGLWFPTQPELRALAEGAQAKPAPDDRQRYASGYED